MSLYELEHIVEKQIDFLRKKGHKDIIAYAWTDMTYRGYGVMTLENQIKERTKRESVLYDPPKPWCDSKVKRLYKSVEQKARRTGAQAFIKEIHGEKEEVTRW